MTKGARAKKLVEVRQKQRDALAASMAHAQVALSEATRRRDAATNVQQQADDASRNVGERTSVQELSDLSTLRVEASRQLAEARRHFLAAEAIFTTKQTGVQAAQKEVRRMERYEERVADETKTHHRARERTALDEIAARCARTAAQRSA